MALNHYVQEEHRHRFLATQYCSRPQESYSARPSAVIPVRPGHSEQFGPPLGVPQQHGGATRRKLGVPEHPMRHGLRISGTVSAVSKMRVRPCLSVPRYSTGVVEYRAHDK